jgi:hypothetical protein
MAESARKKKPPTRKTKRVTRKKAARRPVKKASKRTRKRAAKTKAARYEIHQLSSWEQYITLVNHPKYRRWAFRGHADSSWVLKSTLLRFFEDRGYLVTGSDHDVIRGVAEWHLYFSVVSDIT